jgi:hypothetical protein
MYLLIPGRHHIITQFQYDYLSGIIQSTPGTISTLRNQQLKIDSQITAIIFAVTSANHSNTQLKLWVNHLQFPCIYMVWMM